MSWARDREEERLRYVKACLRFGEEPVLGRDGRPDTDGPHAAAVWKKVHDEKLVAYVMET